LRWRRSTLLVGDAAAAASAPDEVDEVPQVDREVPAVSRPGDLWQIGDHALLCADALKPESYRRLLQTRRAQMVFTDPPYNVRITGNVSGLGRVKHREFAMASGEMTEAEFTTFLKRILTNLVDFSTDGSIHFICMYWRHLRELTQREKLVAHIDESDNRPAYLILVASPSLKSNIAP
jgi:hypothetical protein